MGIPMLYGDCRGGPWKNKQFAHPEPVIPVVIDRAGKGWWPETDAPANTEKRGQYRWNEAERAWDWNA